MDLKRRKIKILGVEVDDISQKDAVDAILEMAKDQKKTHQVVTVNVEMVMLARRNPEFFKILRDADLCVPDGQWIVWSKLILAGKEHDRVTGVDLIEKLCVQSAKRAVTVGFLGGFGSVADEVKKRQLEKNPGLKVIFAGPGDDVIGHDSRLKREIWSKKRLDILFVAYGMGRQEFWIEKMKKKLDVGVFIGVGGAFDYVSMVKKRAPVAWQRMGIEWLWRLLMEPARIWRQRVIPLFMIMMVFNVIAKKLNFSKF